MDGNQSPEGFAMDTWRPITDDEFYSLLAEQYSELNSDERSLFDQHRVSPWKATIRRTEEAGDENVFVVAQLKDWVLYFDDVEYAFEFSDIDSTGRILSPRCSQNTIKEALERWCSAKG
jgi:hypothetical protein